MTVHRNKLRHLISFHNSDTLGFEYDSNGRSGQDIPLSVFSNRKYTEATGDVVWMVSRRAGRKTYFLYGKMRIWSRSTTIESGYLYSYKGRGTILPEGVKLHKQTWFRRLLEMNPNLSQGLQSILAKDVIDGLNEEYRVAAIAQFGEARPLAVPPTSRHGVTKPPKQKGRNRRRRFKP